MRLCFFGDSFVNGTGDPDCRGWVGRICAAVWPYDDDLTCYNLGIRRNTSTDVAGRWRQEAEQRLPPDSDGRLVFSFGVNDCIIEDGRRRVAFDETLANARAILTEACRWKPCLFIGPPPIADDAANERIASLSAALGLLCRDLDVAYLPIYDLLAASPVWMGEVISGDGAHPGAGGYGLLADHISRWSAWRDWFGA